MDSTLYCEGAVLEIPDDLAGAMIADGTVGAVKATKKAPAKKKSPAKKKAE